jgi:hypothetical protein
VPPGASSRRDARISTTSDTLTTGLPIPPARESAPGAMAVLAQHTIGSIVRTKQPVGGCSPVTPDRHLFIRAASTIA